MDRLEAMKIFVAALDEGSLAGASRRTGRSPAAVSRAIAALEAHVGVPLLHRTTRSIKLSEAGERYAAASRRVLAELEQADREAAGERSVPRGTLTITSTLYTGIEILRPIVDAFIDAYPTVHVRLQLLERPVNLIDEGIDVALRITHLADSTLVAKPVGEVRRILIASPRYLATHPRIDDIADLAKHAIITTDHMGLDSWSFPATDATSLPRSVSFVPRMVVNSIHAALASVVGGAWHRPRAFVPRGRAARSGCLADRVARCRTEADSCLAGIAAGATLRSKGARIRGFRVAEAARGFRATAGLIRPLRGIVSP